MSEAADDAPPATGPSVDGRRARRDRNRDLVLDAVLELFAEGHLTPSAPQVARRSGVSPRSVFRYYEDTEALLRAAMARHIERVAPLFEIGEPGGSFDDRLERFVAARLRLHAAVAPTVRAGLLRAATSPPIAERLEWARRNSREHLEAMFAPELGALAVPVRRVALHAADVLFQFEGVEHLRGNLGLDEAQAGEVLRGALRSLLRPPD